MGEIIKESDCDITIEIGHETVTIQKMFGPLMFCDIRIRPDKVFCERVVERQCISKENVMTFEEVCRIDGQESIYFNDEEDE